MRFSDLFNSPLVLREGPARIWAARELRRIGHAIDPCLRGGSKIIAFYTDPMVLRGVIIRRKPTGGLTVQRFGVLTGKEIKFLHELKSSL